MISLTRPTTPPHLCEIQFYFLLSPRPPRVAEFPERALFPAFDFIAATTTAQYSSPLGSAPPLNNTSKLSLQEEGERTGMKSRVARIGENPGCAFSSVAFRRKVFLR